MFYCTLNMTLYIYSKKQQLREAVNLHVDVVVAPFVLAFCLFSVDVITHLPNKTTERAYSER